MFNELDISLWHITLAHIEGFRLWQPALQRCYAVASKLLQVNAPKFLECELIVRSFTRSHLMVLAHERQSSHDLQAGVLPYCVTKTPVTCCCLHADVQPTYLYLGSCACWLTVSFVFIRCKYTPNYQSSHCIGTSAQNTLCCTTVGSMPQKPLLKAGKKIDKKQAANRHGKTPKTRKGKYMSAHATCFEMPCPSKSNMPQLTW